MIRIPLTKGKFALVDDEDYALLARYSWSSVPAKSKIAYFYAKRSNKSGIGPKTIYMHRAIMRVTLRSVHVDHINGDGLDNRRSNLRICTISQNNYAKRRGKLAVSGYRGVYQEGEIFAAQISVGGKTKRIGKYKDPLEAAMAFDLAALRYCGEFAVLNFPQARP